MKSTIVAAQERRHATAKTEPVDGQYRVVYPEDHPDSDDKAASPHLVEDKAGDASLEPGEASLQINLTDLGNARRLVARHGREIRYCPSWNSWLVWDGRC